MTEQTQLVRIHATIEGRVQGVGFRYFVLERANALGITGWVRNRFDGTVEVIAEGDVSKIDQLIAHLRRGPRSAFVSEIKLERQSPTSEFSRFRILPTG